PTETPGVSLSSRRFSRSRTFRVGSDRAELVHPWKLVRDLPGPRKTLPSRSPRERVERASDEAARRVPREETVEPWSRELPARRLSGGLQDPARRRLVIRTTPARGDQSQYLPGWRTSRCGGAPSYTTRSSAVGPTRIRIVSTGAPTHSI